MKGKERIKLPCEIISAMVEGRRTIALAVTFGMSLLFLIQMSDVLAQQSPINNQNTSTTTANITNQNNITAANNTIDQAFDSLRDTFGSIQKIVLPITPNSYEQNDELQIIGHYNKT